MSKRTRARRPARPLLVATGGLAAIAFAGNVACGGGPIAGLPAGMTCRGGCGIGAGTTNGSGTSEGSGSGGTTGTAVQYCGVPDGGEPYACFPDGGPSSDGSTGSGGTT